ncbi:MAG: peptidoglycan-binding domain-containing protein [Almyronema sp.]
MTLAKHPLINKRQTLSRLSQLCARWSRLAYLSAIASGLAITPAVAQSPPTEAASPTENISATQQRGARPTLRLNSEGEPVIELQALLKLLGYYTGAVNGVYGEETQTAVAQFQQAAELSVDGIVGPATWNRLLPSPPDLDSPPATSAAETTDETVEAATPATAEAATPDPATSATPTEATPAATTANAAPETTATAEPATAASPAAANPPRTNASAPVELPVLRQGMYGPAVARLQQRLQALGFYSGAIDGIFGPATERAVQQAQRQYQLTADGIVGSATWSALLR